MIPRAVKLSKTFNDQLVDQIDHGEQRFGRRVAEQKKEKVLATIEGLLARNPAVKRPHPALGLVIYPVTDTPFIVLYDFTETELRVHFILHKNASLEDLDPGAAEW
ncbi:MAG: type II toxin-antitoxin system RelE/ParE family toxin [Hyphomicrobiaceae bacterium]